MKPQKRFVRSAGLALVLAATIALPAWTASHQGGQAAPADPGRPAAPAATPQANPVEMTDGEVRRLDKETGKLTIRHATIKSLDMPPMTMVFVAKDKAMLDKLKVGDKIKFSAIKDAGQYTVTEIQVAQ